MRAGEEARSRFRGDIQGLRAVAVLLVLLAHAEVPGLVGGFVGVDVFFVISGYLITGVLVREVRRTGRVSIADFYARRARRILPAASVTLIAVVIASAWLDTAGTDEVLTHAIWAALFAANVYAMSNDTGYFADSVPPLQHLWSLAVEEQFYLVWPALIAVLLALRSSRPGDRPRRLPRRLLAAVLVLSAASLAWSVWYTPSEPQTAYYLTASRAWELGLGAMLALGAHRLGVLPPAFRALLSWSGIGYIAVAALTSSAATPYPGYHALLPAVGAALVLAGHTKHGAGLLLDRRTMRWFGDISYSLYLWHWPLLKLPPVLLDRDLRPAERLALALAAIVVAAISYRYVETPIRYARTLSAHRTKALLMWPASAAAVLVTVLAIQAL